MAESNQPLLELKSLAHAYGERCVLHQIDLTQRIGEVHALIGGNGAGKSTLVRILAGQLQPARGQIFWRGAAVRLGSPAVARDLGIVLVPQELGLFQQLTVEQNFAVVVARARRHQSRRLITPPPPTVLEPQRRVGGLNSSEQQLLAIQLGLALHPSLLILDESTASLSPELAAWVKRLVRSLAQQGSGVLMISHRPRDLVDSADCTTRLAEGRIARDESSEPLRKSPQPANLPLPTQGRFADNPVTQLVFQWRGRAWEFARSQFYGLVFDDPTAAADYFDSIALTAVAPEVLQFEGQKIGRFSARQRRNLGIRVLPAPQRGAGLVGGLTLLESLFLTGDSRLIRFGLLRRKPALELAHLLLAEGEVGGRPQDYGEQFSGGNRQKLALLRELSYHPRLLILEQGFNGLDQNAVAAMRHRIAEHQAQGMTTILLGLDREEIAPYCDRIVDV
ncbi:MAG: ATP-binding cassette domain-containing protein [Alphaproteobacteria bacterium]|nr:ATP-binding cassette domain-containing protein [Alphaproteobacteria bacterium]